MDTHDIASIRLTQQGILGNRYTTFLELTKALGALQAQDYYGSLWAIGLRTGLTERQVVDELGRQRIIRTWPQRGTLHVVPADDAGWQVNLSAERMVKGSRHRRDQLAITPAVLEQSQHIIEELLQQHPLAPRPTVMAALETGGITTKNGRGYHILWYLSQTGITYIGPMASKQQTVGLLHTVVPDAINLSRSQAIAELTRRYFTSHGPATQQDFMWWSGLTATDVKTGIAANQATLRSETIGGKIYWLASDAVPIDIANTIFLLPGFDEYLLGYQDRSAVLQPQHQPKIVPGNNGMFLPTVILDGKVVGTWKRIIKKDAVTIEVVPFTHLCQANRKLLEEPAAAYGTFMRLPWRLEILEI